MLVRRLAAENPTWGAPRVHGELRMLGFDVSERTVSRLMPRRAPNHEAVQRWMAFLRNHRDGIAAMDTVRRFAAAICADPGRATGSGCRAEAI